MCCPGDRPHHRAPAAATSSSSSSAKMLLTTALCAAVLLSSGCVGHGHQEHNLAKGGTGVGSDKEAGLLASDSRHRRQAEDGPDYTDYSAEEAVEGGRPHVEDHDEHGDHDHHGHGALEASSSAGADCDAFRGEEVRHDIHGNPYCHSGSAGGTLQMWAWASAAVLAISLCGVFGVLVVPIMQRVFYQHLLQFLVALAVGTLSGDALLHLLPHAIISGAADLMTHDRVEQLEKDAIWRSFSALVAFMVFFLLERVINILGARRATQRRRKSQNGGGHGHEHPEVEIVRSGHRTSEKAVGKKQCKSKYSSYCVSDVDEAEAAASVASLNEGNTFGAASAADPNSKLLTIEETTDEEGSRSNGQAGTTTTTASTATTTTTKLFVHDHENLHHGHSHAHSHLTSKPENISSVAWMVIFGDGMHNLTDGLAIGAAFTQSAALGLATSIAILCHELPHEIGDFAMLLKAGMTVRQAVFYNLVSSVLSFMGMTIGILLGNVESLSAWIFGATAGVFLYVALVDMIPELSSGHAHPYTAETQADPYLLELGLQLLGMLLGSGIMLVIALYEHEFTEALSSSSHP